MQPLPIKPLRPLHRIDPSVTLVLLEEWPYFEGLATSKLEAFKRDLLTAVAEVRLGIKDAQEFLAPPRTIIRPNGDEFTTRIRGHDRKRMQALLRRRQMLNCNLAWIRGILKERTKAQHKKDVAARAARRALDRLNNVPRWSEEKITARRNRLIVSLHKIRSERARYKKALSLAHEERRRVCPDTALIKWCRYFVVSLQPKIKGARTSLLALTPEAPRPSAQETDPSTSTES